MKQICTFFISALLFFGVVPVSLGADGATNYPLNSIVIKCEDAVTHAMLPGARFEVYYNNQAVSGGYGTLVATIDTDSSGVIVIGGLPSGYYIIRQTVPPNNYHLSITNEQHAYIKPDGTSVEELIFSNYRYGGLVVLLSDKDTGKPIGNAAFSVTDVSNKAVGTSADGVYTTDAKGEFYLENLPAGDYKITQLTTAQGYAMDSLPNMRTVRLQHTNADQSVFRAAFENSPLGSLLIRLKDGANKTPLSGAKFSVKLSGGADLGEFTTDANGTILLTKIAKGTYIVSQISAPTGYIFANSTKTQYVDYVNTYAVDFENAALASLQIIKTDEYNGIPLFGARFRITTQSGEFVADVTTDSSGKASVPGVAPGWYVVAETKAPAGYIISETAKTVEVKANIPTVLTVTNRAVNSLEIVKLDYFTRQPLPGATFKVEHSNGANVGTFRTDGTDKTLVGTLAEDTYVVSEIAAPQGYQLDSEPQTVAVQGGKLTAVEFLDKPLSGIEIVKTDKNTHTPLSGTVFTVEKTNGERIGKYTTDITGKVIIPGLEAGVYIISEVQAPENYLLDAQPQMVEVKSGKLTVAEFADTELPSLYIRKTDSATGALVAGARFTVTNQRGETIAEVVSISSGAVIIPHVRPGIYTITETKSPAGYELNDPVRTVEVTAAGDVHYNSSAVTGNTATFADNPLNTLEILKLDSVTRNVLSGAVFEVTKANGEKIGTFRTDASGKIIIPDLKAGTYVVCEISAPQGYILNSTPQNVTVGDGKSTALEVPNTPFSGLLILKTDEATHKPLAGVKFEVKKPNGEQIGIFTTDISGEIRITDIPARKLVIVETQALDGYELDTSAHEVTIFPGKQTTLEVTNKQKAGLRLLKIDSITKKGIYDVEFKSGKVTEVIWENTPQMGQIQITKLSGDDNEINGFAKGTPLSGAVFIDECLMPIYNETPWGYSAQYVRNRVRDADYQARVLQLQREHGRENTQNGQL